MLGQVTEINPLGITLALPNNLSGHVPITAISDILNEKIAADAESVDGEEEEDCTPDGRGDDDVHHCRWQSVLLQRRGTLGLRATGYALRRRACDIR